MSIAKTGRSTPRKVIGSSSEFEVDKIKLYELYNLIRNHKDERGRELAIPFLQLPSKFVSFNFEIYQKNLASENQVSDLYLLISCR